VSRQRCGGGTKKPMVVKELRGCNSLGNEKEVEKKSCRESGRFFGQSQPFRPEKTETMNQTNTWETTNRQLEKKKREIFFSLPDVTGWTVVVAFDGKGGPYEKGGGERTKHWCQQNYLAKKRTKKPGRRGRR